MSINWNTNLRTDTVPPSPSQHKKPQRVRMIDIADAAGVSYSVVSAVLNDRRDSSIRVSEETAERVRAIARQLDYYPNVAAQILAKGKSRIIGVLIDTQANSAYWEVFRRFENLAANDGYRCLVGQAHDDEENFRQLLNDFQAYNPAAVVAFAHAYPHCDFNLYPHLRQFANIVLYGEENSPAPSFPAVDADWEDCYYTLTQRSLAAGRRRIALMTSTPFYTKQYVAGYTRALQEAGMPLQPELLIPKTNANKRGRDCKVMASQLLEVRADAFFAEDIIVAPLSNALQEHGVNVPDDIWLFGRDDEVFCTFMRPALSSINHNAQESAAALYELTQSIIAGDTPAPKLHLVKAQLMERQSSRLS